MNRWVGLALAVVCALATAAPRWTQDKPEPGRARISIYRVAPGRHLDVLKWLAAREEIAKEAGLPPTQLFAHTDGDSWDYLLIWPITTAEQERRLDEAAGRKGLKTGFAAALEFRELLASHTDTFVNGPMTAAELVAAASK
jgi:hypothetical protein